MIPGCTDLHDVVCAGAGTGADRCSWTLKGGGTLVPSPFCVMGVVNVTPDSFSDGGRYLDPGAASAHARSLVADGAHVLDVGGESTRPYADPVSAAEEQDRILPVIRDCAAVIGSEGGPVPVSVDTYKASTAAAALDAGAAIVNDVSACRFDPELMDVLAQYRPGYVLMHSLGRPGMMQDSPRYDNVVEEVHAFFGRRLERLAKAGLDAGHVVLDPGIGFGKTLEHNVALLRGLGRFLDHGRPLLVGLSNKSLWQKLLGLETDRRANATQVGTAMAALRGATIHRVHDVLHARETLRIVETLG